MSAYYEYDNMIATSGFAGRRGGYGYDGLADNIRVVSKDDLEFKEMMDELKNQREKIEGLKGTVNSQQTNIEYLFGVIKELQDEIKELQDAQGFSYVDAS